MDPSFEELKERKMIRRGVDRFYRHQQQAEAAGKKWDTHPHAQLIDRMVAKLLPDVRKLQAAARRDLLALVRDGRRAPLWADVLLLLDPVVVSYTTCRSLLNSTVDGGHASRHVHANRISTVLSLEAQLAQLKDEEGKLAKNEGRRSRLADLKRQVKEINPRTVRKWLKKLDDIATDPWDYEKRQSVGLQLMETAASSLTEYLRVETRRVPTGHGGLRWVDEVRLTDEVISELRESVEASANQFPWLVPMVCRPRDYVGDQPGGYLILDHDILKRADYSLTNRPSVTQEVLDAVNRIQSVGWRVNTDVLSVAIEAFEQGAGEVLPVDPPKDLPGKLSDEAWEGMTTEERRQHKSTRRLIHDHNNKLAAKYDAMQRTLNVAEEHAEFPAIYFPHNIDFRGRVYPLCQDLHPQADDLSRGLLRFAEGKPLGPNGLRWVCHAVAAAYGEDKLTLDEQIGWCIKHTVDLYHVANAPLNEGYDFWVEADEPWQFLAAAMEFDAIMRDVENAAQFVSHLPIYVDGTCNGLQHLSAMGRDPVGARAVNLYEGPRQDIYQDVADKVVQHIKEDRELDNIEPVCPQAENWWGHVTRKTVKRGVMTTPYGVTREGMLNQLLRDGVCTHVGGDHRENAMYMRDKMVEAIESTVVAGVAIMKWMQEVATNLAEDNKPVVWTTPTGMKCVQEYRTPTKKRISTLLGEASIQIPNKNGELRGQKQRNSIAPNIIHSFDAAHLVKTINACAEDSEGPTSFAVVHDSFGTHACDVDRLSDHLRQEFFLIYSEDWLAKLADDFEKCAGYRADWIEPPRTGDFDIREVLTSTYFFF